MLPLLPTPPIRPLPHFQTSKVYFFPTKTNISEASKSKLIDNKNLSPKNQTFTPHKQPPTSPSFDLSIYPIQPYDKPMPHKAIQQHLSNKTKLP